MTLTPTRHEAATADLLAAWEAFVDAVQDDDVYQVIGTEEAVEALIHRSLLQEALDESPSAGDALERLSEADRRYLAAAPALLEHTRVALYHDDEPPHHWWWRVEEIVLGERSQTLLTVPEAVVAKGVHAHTIRAAIKSGALPARRLARGFLIHRRDLERWAPAKVGRPRRTTGTIPSDALLDAFNQANTSGDFEKAHAVARVLSRSPTSSRRQLALAIDSLNRGQIDECVHWLDRFDAAELPPESRETAVLVRAIAFLKRGEPDAAISLLAPDATPQLGWRGWVALAEALLAVEDRASDARVAAAKAVAAAPAETAPRYIAARVAWRTDHVWEALEHVTVFRAFAPTDPDGLVLHGAILGYLGDTVGDRQLYERAQELFAEAVASRPDSLGRLGVVKARLGQWRDALLTARELASAQSDPEDVLDAALAAAAENHDPSETMAAVEAIEAEFGRSELTKRYSAFAKAAAADVRGTIRELRALDPDASTEKTLLAALAHERAGDAYRAYTLFRKHLGARSPDSLTPDFAYWATRLRRADPEDEVAKIQLRTRGLFSGHGDEDLDFEDFTNRVLIGWQEDTPTARTVWAGRTGTVSSVVYRTSTTLVH